MLRMISTFSTAVVLTLAFVSSVLAQPHHHEGDFVIGQSGDPAYQLRVHGDPDILSGEESIHLPYGEGIFIGMFAGDDPGWIGLEEDEPDEGMYMLAPGHQVSLKRLDFDAGFSMYDPTAGQVLLADGDAYLFPVDGEGFIHSHLFFVGEGELGDTWSATFQLVDLGGQYADSDPFTLNFEATPEPTTLAMLLCGAMLLTRRRA